MSCTTILAGKKITETGLVIAAHNEDERGRYVLYHGILPERDWDLNDPKQAVLPAEKGLAEIPQAKHTFRSYWVEHVNPLGGESNGDMFYNRFGVLFTSNSGQLTKPDPDDPKLVKEGGLAYNVRRVVGERATSARHGVQIVLSLLAEWGYAPSGRNYTIADKNEAWNIQTVRGFYYAAARVPDDAVMVLPNHLTIHSLTEFPVSLALDPKDPQVPMDMDLSDGAILYPSDLITHAIENGWYTPSVPGETADFDFAFVYQKKECWKTTYNTNRHLHGMRLLMHDPDLQCPHDPLAELHQDPNPNYYPFCIRPNDPIHIEDLAEVLCSHAALTSNAKVSLGPGRSPHLHKGMILCYGNSTETTITCFAEQNEQTTIWTAFGRSCHQPFIPLHPLNGIPEIMEPLSDPSEAIQKHIVSGPERTCWKNNAWWQGFRAFQELAEMQFADIEKPLQELRHDHLNREKEINNKILAENGDLKTFDKERIDAALKEWKDFSAKHFNLAEIVPHETICRDSTDPAFRIYFRMPKGQVPQEEGMVFAQGMAPLGTDSANIIPGSLRSCSDGTWEACFESGNIMNKAFSKGDFDYYLGGINTEGRTFAAQTILHFL